MNNEKLVVVFDGLASICIKLFILFKVLSMLLTAISIRILGYRILSVLLECVIIAFAVYYLKKFNSENEEIHSAYTKEVIIAELKIYSKLYVKVVSYTLILLLLLSFIITYE